MKLKNEFISFLPSPGRNNALFLYGLCATCYCKYLYILSCVTILFDAFTCHIVHMYVLTLLLSWILPSVSVQFVIYQLYSANTPFMPFVGILALLLPDFGIPTN